MGKRKRIRRFIVTIEELDDDRKAEPTPTVKPRKTERTAKPKRWLPGEVVLSKGPGGRIFETIALPRR